MRLLPLESAASIPAYLVLLRVGFTLRLDLRRARCALTAPFHPYLPLACAGGLAVRSLLHWPSRGLEPSVPDVIRHTALRSSDFPPPRDTLAGARGSDHPAACSSSVPRLGRGVPPSPHLGRKSFICNGLQGVNACKIFILKGLRPKYCIETGYGSGKRKSPTCWPGFFISTSIRACGCWGFRVFWLLGGLTRERQGSGVRKRSNGGKGASGTGGVEGTGVRRCAQDDGKNKQRQGQGQRQKQIPFGDDNQKDNGRKRTTARQRVRIFRERILRRERIKRQQQILFEDDSQRFAAPRRPGGWCNLILIRDSTIFTLFTVVTRAYGD
jgi:hypothetical protein